MARCTPVMNETPTHTSEKACRPRGGVLVSYCKFCFLQQALGGGAAFPAPRLGLATPLRFSGNLPMERGLQCRS